MAVPWSRPDLWSSLPKRLTLPPEQRADHQVELSGKIRLASGSGPWIGTHHKQATSRKGPQIPAHEVTEPPADLVADHCGAHGPAHHESNPGRVTALWPHQEAPAQQGPAGPPAAAGRPELSRMAHPRGRGEHRRSLPRRMRTKVRH
jgi:hypothetical protein